MKQEFSIKTTLPSFKTDLLYEKDKSTEYPYSWEGLINSIEELFNNPDKSAIELLFQMSEKIIRHKALFYALKSDNQKIFKNNYPRNFEQNINFFKDKTMHCYTLGQQQGLFRLDVNKELIGRMVIKKLMNLNDPQIFTQQTLTYKTNYYTLFYGFIQSLCTNEGLRHFKYFFQIETQR